MYKNIELLTHSSIRITEDKIAYIDPFMITDARNDADVIFITHSHSDHYSLLDIAKVVNDKTVFVMPNIMEKEFMSSLYKAHLVKFVDVNQAYLVNGFKFTTVPAYNINKPMHPKTNGWVGYIFELSSGRCYIAGDTDLNPDVYRVKCDIAMIPIGGKYTMDGLEAAELINAIRPKIAIPTHYGKLMRNAFFGEIFKDAVNNDIEVIDLLKID